MVRGPLQEEYRGHVGGLHSRWPSAGPGGEGAGSPEHRACAGEGVGNMVRLDSG